MARVEWGTLAKVAGVLVVGCLLPVLVLVAAPLVGVDPSTMQGSAFRVTGPHVALMLAVVVVMMAVPLAAYRWLHGGRITDLGFRGEVLRNSVSGHLLGFALVAVVLGVEMAMADGVTLTWAVPSEVGWGKLGFSYLFFVVAIVFLQSLKEELLFRAYPLEVCLGMRTRPTVALLVSAVLFAAVHLVLEPPTWTGFFDRFLFGVLFGQVYLASRSIWAAVGVHNGWNWGLSTLSGDWQLGGLWDLSAQVESELADLVGTGVLVLVVVGLGLALRRDALGLFFVRPHSPPSNA